MNKTSSNTQVSFFEAIKIVASKYADFSGLASRSEFWWWSLFAVLVSAVLNVFNVVEVNQSTTLGSILISIWSILTLLPNLAVGVRRLRDAGYSWPYLFLALIPIAGIIILIVLFTQPSKQLSK